MQALARLEPQFADRSSVPDIALRTEALAALRPAASEQTPAALGGHAGPEAMGACAVQITGIECAFHKRKSKS